MDADAHDQLCAWISHLPQLISTALAATLVDEYGEDAPLLETGGRALREMTRISGSPYSMWRDVALTNKKNIRQALLEAGTAAGAHPRESGYAGAGAGVRAGASTCRKAALNHRSRKGAEKQEVILRSPLCQFSFSFRILLTYE